MTSTQTYRGTLAKCLVPCLLLSGAAAAQMQIFHGAPVSAKTDKNPYQGQNAASGKAAFQLNCAACHGPAGEGSGNIPSLAGGAAQGASDGELFWYITQGDVDNGMPSWQALPQEQRWEIVNYIRVLGASKPGSPRVFISSDEAIGVGINAAPPRTPFTDYRFEKPGTIRKITLKDLPAPLATTSAGNSPQLVARPETAWPQVPAGFKVELYASGLDQPRLIRTAPNGDFFVAESRLGEIRVFRGITADGKPQQSATFAAGLKRPFGINFYPAGPSPQWVYVGNTDSVVRFPYKNGDLAATGPPEHLADLPSGAGHWTRDIQFAPDGRKMFVSVGSASNINDPDTTPEEKHRADVLEFNPDGSAMRVYAYGIRNCVGLAIQSKTGALWCSVNERDGLGDDLVPDYITRVQEGGFYGWPWWYMGKHQDPRHEGRHPELKDKVITPDVILNPHNASLELAFYDGKQFPSEFQGDIFAAEHGSWNRSVRVGYELIRVPLDKAGNATGAYEDFMTGFVVDNGHVWGRPVGVAVAHDGSLLVTDDGSKSVWRISYTGAPATGAAPVTVSVPEKSQPESITVAPDGDLILGSMSTPKIYRAKKGTDKVGVFVDAGADGAVFFLGVLADAPTNTLWACEIYTTPPGSPPHSALRGFDLKTGAGKFRWELPGDKNLCNDFVVGPDKALYISDTVGAKIWRLKQGAAAAELFSDDRTLLGIDGITFIGDSLYENNVIFNKLYRVPIDEGGKAGRPVDIWMDKPVKGPDGMRAANGKLFLAENGAGRIDMVTVSGDTASITVLQEGLATPTAIEPTAGTLWYGERAGDRARSMPLPK